MSEPVHGLSAGFCHYQACQKVVIHDFGSIFVSQWRFKKPSRIWLSFLLNGKPVHLNVKAFFEAARLALISSLFVNNAVAVSLAGVNHVPSHAPHEKTTAPVARIHAIVPSRRYISADFTENFGLSFNCF